MKKITSVFHLEKDLLPEYSAFEKINSGNWSIHSYLNMKYDLNAALAFSKLYFPDFIEVQGCLILDFRYKAEVFSQWFTKYNGDISKVEYMCNYYDLADFFHINVGDESDQNLDKKDGELGKILQGSWMITCNAVFPGKTINIELIENDGIPGITLYQSLPTH